MSVDGCCSNKCEQCCQLFLKVCSTCLNGHLLLDYLPVHHRSNIYWPCNYTSTYVLWSALCQGQSGHCPHRSGRVWSPCWPCSSCCTVEARRIEILHEGTEKYDTSLQEVSLSPILITPLWVQVSHVVDSWVSRVTAEIAGYLSLTGQWQSNIGLSELWESWIDLFTSSNQAWLAFIQVGWHSYGKIWLGSRTWQLCKTRRQKLIQLYGLAFGLERWWIKH